MPSSHLTHLLTTRRHPADDSEHCRRSRRPVRVPASPFAFLGRKTASRDAFFVLDRSLRGGGAKRGGGGLDSAEKRSDDGCPASWEI